MRKAARNRPRPSLRAQPAKLSLYHALLLGGGFLFWYLMTEPGLIPPFYFDDPTRAKFFFGQPLEVLKRIWNWFAGGSIYLHLGVTLIETLLAFAIGTVLAESGDDKHRWVRRVIGYGLGIGTGYQRLNHDAHWLSDTVAGAALGIATAKFVLRRHERTDARGEFALRPVDGGTMLTYTVPLRR